MKNKILIFVIIVLCITTAINSYFIKTNYGLIDKSVGLIDTNTELIGNNLNLIQQTWEVSQINTAMIRNDLDTTINLTNGCFSSFKLGDGTRVDMAEYDVLTIKDPMKITVINTDNPCCLKWDDGFINCMVEGDILEIQVGAKLPMNATAIGIPNTLKIVEVNETTKVYTDIYGNYVYTKQEYCDIKNKREEEGWKYEDRYCISSTYYNEEEANILIKR